MRELADAVIVGGGIAGAALAAALGRRLSRVVLLEAGRCGKLATENGFAWVNASSKWSDRNYHDLNAEACRAHRRLAADWGSERTGWKGGGTLFWADPTDTTAADLLRRQLAVLTAWEFALATLSREEMQALEPNIQFPEEAVGFYCPSEGWVDTRVLTPFLLGKAREEGVDIYESTPAVGLTRDHTGAIATVATPAGRISTRLLFLAAGMETGNLANMAAGGLLGTRMEIGGSPGLLLEIPDLPEPSRIYRVCYPHDLHALHIRPTAGDGILAGADDTDLLAAETTDRSDTGHTQIFEAAKKLLLSRLETVVGSLPDSTGASMRLCRRPMPPDGLPIVGRLPGVGGVYLLTTHSGVTLAPLLAQRLADEALSGRESPDLAPYRPARFFD